jgi:creatinine amidohydrolase/Fe(II)-dependent formamide hydrolase-like protein
MERAEAGFTGELEEAMAGIFASGGVAALSENGAIGDPSRASAEHGRRYWDAAVELVLEQIAAASPSP